ncbi:MAG: alginate O-acetyltransferase AlgF [Pseudomonadales bacterium]|nr:alginate O-acetyltransferase AlgF [Pseudomonadales bacterium]
MRKYLTNLFALFVMAPAMAAELADGDDLYEKAGPNSAFVRLVNLSGETMNATVSGKALDASGLCAISQTVIVESGLHAVEGAGWNWQQQLEAGRIYTIAVNGDVVTPFSQVADRNPMRAKFEVFNLSGKPGVSVRTAEKKQAVFSDLAPSNREERQLNPLRVTLEIATEDLVTSVEPIAFSRGRTTSMTICDDAGQLAVNVVTE